MIDWLSKQKRDQKRKEKRDKKLREELSAKAKEHQPESQPSQEDFTEITIKGVRHKVPVDRITLVDTTPQHTKKKKDDD